MQIILELPEDIARNLQSDGTELSRTALESLAIEGIRSGKLSTGQVRRLLGFGTSYEVDGFLKGHGVDLDLSLDDIEKDVQTAAEFSERWLSSQTPRR